MSGGPRKIRPERMRMAGTEGAASRGAPVFRFAADPPRSAIDPTAEGSAETGRAAARTQPFLTIDATAYELDKLWDMK